MSLFITLLVIAAACLIIIFLIGIHDSNPELLLVVSILSISLYLLIRTGDELSSNSVADDIANDRVYVAKEYTITESGDTLAIKGRIIRK
jgi:hypothetical protein